MIDVETIFDSDREEYEFMQDKKEQTMKEQIEEMRKDLIEIFDEEYEKRRLITPNFTAEKMTAKGYRKQEWISVNDRLPDTDEVLVYRREGVGHAAPKKQGLDKMDWDVFFNIAKITHWMPLPQPPKMKGGAD